MFRLASILGLAIFLAACGQKGPLYLPTGEAASVRATLPQSLNPVPAASAPTETGTGTANPAPRP
ncbi:MAG TPA: lipoprotein [Ramlibacter sp.]|nr:lipoprotein [Ramlibacter sp.]